MLYRAISLTQEAYRPARSEALRVLYIAMKEVRRCVAKYVHLIIDSDAAESE